MNTQDRYPRYLVTLLVVLASTTAGLLANAARHVQAYL